ncbi:helix-turn-helix transcriptional regulator [Polynucleobacter paludilacus]|uniref:helix-turn-helix domain-containing protein n=1 Tax=Polynucleobacter paludilacus TaxID=1855895 RepID=UPI00210C3D57|nr:helix-turn-helix transcriptional regulator [Polynucleobacter paludilacus]QWD87487.1 helix-turn-helix transcriptional regulator [Polynucleobacter paludilacus]
MNISTEFLELDQAAFIKAREALGLSIQELAAKACLSVRQVEQIENGGQSSFYSLKIKNTAAKKIANLLKLNEALIFKSADIAGVQDSQMEQSAVKPAPQDTVETIDTREATRPARHHSSLLRRDKYTARL